MERYRSTKPAETVNPNFHPSPTMKVHFAGGEVVAMNRRDRRRQHLYGDRLKREKRTGPPPGFRNVRHNNPG